MDRVVMNYDFCDGLEDCSDGSDEKNYEDKACMAHHVKCADRKRCIHVSNIETSLFVSVAKTLVQTTMTQISQCDVCICR